MKEVEVAVLKAGELRQLPQYAPGTQQLRIVLDIYYRQS
jgi:hypothetical protein